MKILISACAADNGQSGIGQYIRATTAALSQRSGEQLELTIYVDRGETFLDDLGERPGVSVQALPRPFAGTLGSLAWHFLILPVITLLAPHDLVLFLAANRRLAWLPGVTTVGVVHDLSQLHITGKYDRFRTFYVLQLLTRLMARLTRIVAVSHSTKRDLVQFAKINANRIAVVHNGAEVSRFAAPTGREVLKTYGIDRPYLIYTARLEHPGKNHVRLLQAFASLPQAADLQLVFAGAPWNGAEAIYAEVERLGLAERVIFTGFAPADHLPPLIQHAALVVFPSLFEGFGIPLLEAMAAGTAVCAANRSSLPEVAGNAALLFDPEDPSDMAWVMQELLDSATQRDQLIALGRVRASHFTWQRSASELLSECQRTHLLANVHATTVTMT